MMKYVIVGAAVILAFAAGVMVILWAWMALDREDAGRQREHEKQLFAAKDSIIKSQAGTIEALESTVAINDETIRTMRTMLVSAIAGCAAVCLGFFVGFTAGSDRMPDAARWQGWSINAGGGLGWTACREFYTAGKWQGSECMGPVRRWSTLK